MLKQPITYTDFDGQQVTENFYFNFSKAEIIELILNDKLETLVEGMQEAVKNADGKEILRSLREIIHLAYGERDDKAFRKSKEISDDFLLTEAFSEFYFDLISNPEKVLAFIEAVIPAQLIEEAKRQGRLPDDLKTLELPREDGQPYYDAAAVQASRPQPQDRLPKQTREVKDVNLFDAQITDTPLSGHEFQVVDGIEADKIVQAEKLQPNETHIAARREILRLQEMERGALSKFDEYAGNNRGLSMTEYGFTEEEIIYLRRNGLA